MKNTRLILIGLSTALICHCAHATVIRVSQLVGLSTGVLGTDASTGTTEGWGNTTTQVTLTNGSGSLDGTALGLVVSAGDRAFTSATSALNVRNQFATGQYPTATTDTNLYYSFLYRFRNAADVSTDGEIIVRLNTQNSGTGSAQHWDLIAKNVGGQIQLGIFKPGAAQTNFATTNINVGQTIFIVVRQQMVPGTANDTNSLWINPPPSAMTADGAESAGSGPGRMVFVAGSNSEFDELRIATTWAEATPAFGSCVGAGIEQQPVPVTQSAELSATFSIKPLGTATSPSIQWQRSTNSGSSWNNIAGANAETYRTPNLSLTESGTQYRAIVSVACNNSSVTSAPAAVTLTAPVATPAGVVMDDTFTDPDLGYDDRSNLPLTSTNSVWFTGASPQSLVAYQQNGNLVGTTVAGVSSLWLGYFVETNQPPVHLAVGRTLLVRLPFIANSYSLHTNNSGLRLGLFDYADGGTRVTADGATAGGSTGNGIGVRGYMLNLDFGPTFSVNSPLQLLVRSSLADNNLMGSSSLYESLGSGPAGGGYSNSPAFQAGQQYTLEFSVARIAVNAVTITTRISGGTLDLVHSVTETNFAYHRFDAFAIRPNSAETTADSFTFPEFKVDVLQGSVAVAPFSITGVQSLATDSIKLTWASESGASYHVLSAPSLTSSTWTTNATVLATGSSTSYTNSPTTGAELYYRVVGLPYTP